MPYRRKPITKRSSAARKSRSAYQKKTTTNSSYQKKSTSYSPYKRQYKPESAQGLSGFDRSIYKVDRILSQVGHGINVLEKPIEKFVSTMASPITSAATKLYNWFRGPVPEPVTASSIRITKKNPIRISRK